MKNINQAIKALKVKLILNDKLIGEKSIYEAKAIAKEYKLDLVQMNEDEVPVCKIMDYKKHLYQLNKKHKKPREIETKELRFHPNTDTHDIERLINQANGFIKKGDNVKFIVMFKGREVTFVDKVVEKFNHIIESMENKEKLEIKRDWVVQNKRMHLYIKPS